MLRFLQIFIQVLGIIGTVYLVLESYRFIVAVIGVLTYKKFRPTDNYHTYGFCIAARNEEKVIENILDSIYHQDYPKDKIKIFVCADNCTDRTADIVREYSLKHGVGNLFLFEHNDPNERTKGFALRYLFDKIKENFGIECVEGYFVFDADNVLQRDYTARMNEAFDGGGAFNRIITSCRLSKNIDSNWLAFSYAVHWMKTCLIENRGKHFLKLSCRIQGTGFLFDNALVKDGWKYTSLTEDRAFCSDAVVQGYHITYCHEAIFYDEQPTKFKIACRQRLRWAKGHLQSSYENCPKLIKNMTKLDRNFWNSYDCYWLNFPFQIEKAARKILIFLCKMSMVLWLGQTFSTLFGYPVWGYLLSILFGFAVDWLSSCALAILVLFCFRKRLRKMPFGKVLAGIFMYPTFGLIGKYATYIALFKRVEWKPIPHESVMDISKLK